MRRASLNLLFREIRFSLHAYVVHTCLVRSTLIPRIVDVAAMPEKVVLNPGLPSTPYIY